ncbi:MAG: GNAT family N-acetyltransferase [Candidatus Binatia bacterium]
MPQFFGPSVAKRIQRIFWIYLTNNFVITGTNDFTNVEPAVSCRFLPITSDNYFRVREFRDEGRVQEYKEKVTREEIGFFAEHDGKMVGSIWATLNTAGGPKVVRSYMRVLPNEALVHDIVAGEQFRGMGIGPYMLGQICLALLGEYRAHKIVVDVNFRNRRSLRMMEKAGLQLTQRVLSISAFGRLISQNVLRQYR